MRPTMWRTELTAWIVIAVAGLTAVGFVFQHRVYLKAELKRVEERSRHATNGREGVRRDLARGRFGEGSSADELVAAYPPTSYLRGQRYGIITYRWPNSLEQVSIITRDGKLATASVNTLDEGGAHLFGEIDHLGADRGWHLDLVAAGADAGKTHMAVAGAAAGVRRP